MISRRRGKARIAGELPLCGLISTTSFSSFSSLISLREVDSVSPALLGQKKREHLSGAPESIHSRIHIETIHKRELVLEEEQFGAFFFDGVKGDASVRYSSSEN